MQVVLDIGVDVAKDTVVVACARQSFAARTLRNTRTELRAWLKSLPAGTRIGLEATGGYHDLLATMAQEQGFIVYLLNPKDVRHYARALGTRGKTDRVDAQVIARYVAHEHARLHPYLPMNPAQRSIDRLLKRRAKLVVLKDALRQSLRDAPELREDLKTMSKHFDTLTTKIDRALLALTHAIPERKNRQQYVQSIVGVGPLVGSCLANTLERVPFKHSDAFIAFTGLDPRADDSGNHRGKRKLSKRGPSQMRRLLFNAAMSASKTAVWKPLYQRYRDRGWSSTAALVIIARKIARIAFVLWHTQTTFNPSRITTGLT